MILQSVCRQYRLIDGFGFTVLNIQIVNSGIVIRNTHDFCLRINAGFWQTNNTSSLDTTDPYNIDVLVIRINCQTAE